MKYKKIMLIIPELGMGGAQRSFSRLSVELARQHQVYVVVFNRNDHKIVYPFGGELQSLEVKPGKGFLNKFYAFILRLIRLRKLKRALSVETSISFLEGADYINILSRLTDRVIISIRGSKRHDETIVGKYHVIRNRLLIPLLYRKADVIVTVNKGIAQELKAHYGLSKINTVTIGNFYDAPEIMSLSLDEKSADLRHLYQSRVLVTSGRLAPEKGLGELINVFGRLKSRFNDLKLVIIGDGPCLKELILSCERFNLSHSQNEEFETEPDVFFAGHQPNVFKYLKGATLYLMNSSSEGFPNGLVEAMICGVPVAAADCPYGPREILAPDFSYVTSVTESYLSETGVLLPLIKTESDLLAWVDYLAGLLDDKNLLSRLAEQGKIRAMSFDKNKMLSAWSSIL